MSNIFRRFTAAVEKAVELPVSGRNPRPIDPNEPRPAPPGPMRTAGESATGMGSKIHRDGLTYEQRSEKIGRALKEASIKTGSFGAMSYDRMESKLAEARQKLVERDFEIAGMRTLIAQLYDRIAELEGG